MGYAGGLADSTGLVKFGDRYYDPGLGRWTQQDSAPGGISDPSREDRYLYASNDPLNRTDPSGKCDRAEQIVGAGIAVVGDLFLAGIVITATLTAPEVTLPVLLAFSTNPLIDYPFLAVNAIGIGVFLHGSQGC